MAYTTFPNSAVCYILADIPGKGEFQATGIIIGPHTILTAAHELWDADVGQGADGVSIYPGFVPNGTIYNPPGALGGTQAVHYIKVADSGGVLNPRGTQHDFAVIDTSLDLTQYGHFALNYGFKSGYTTLLGYPANNGGNQTGAGGNVSAGSTYSDLDTRGLSISPGDSGGPLFDQISNGHGRMVDAVTGLVSTGNYATKINRRKIGIIKNWVNSDSGLWTGQGSPGGSVTPQLGGTVDSGTLAASLSNTARPSGFETASAVATDNVWRGEFSTMVEVLHQTQSVGVESRLTSAAAAESFGLAAQYGWLDHRPHHYAFAVTA